MSCLLRLSHQPLRQSLRSSCLPSQSCSRPSPALLRQSRYSTATPSEPPSSPSAHRSFYKTFGRPVAKVFLGALFVYQGTYWIWAKLESDEICADKDREIKALEEELKKVMDKK